MVDVAGIILLLGRSYSETHTLAETWPGFGEDGWMGGQREGPVQALGVDTPSLMAGGGQCSHSHPCKPASSGGKCCICQARCSGKDES